MKTILENYLEGQATSYKDHVEEQITSYKSMLKRGPRSTWDPIPLEFTTTKEEYETLTAYHKLSELLKELPPGKYGIPGLGIISKTERAASGVFADQQDLKITFYGLKLK